MQIVLEYKKPTSQVYFENIFNNFNFDWNKIYIFPRLVTLDSVLCSFQYKVLHNVLYKNCFFFEMSFHHYVPFVTEKKKQFYTLFILVYLQKRYGMI